MHQLNTIICKESILMCWEYWERLWDIASFLVEIICHSLKLLFLIDFYVFYHTLWPFPCGHFVYIYRRVGAHWIMVCIFIYCTNHLVIPAIKGLLSLLSISLAGHVGFCVVNDVQQAEIEELGYIFTYPTLCRLPVHFKCSILMLTGFI